jgi:catechol 2,3-dioxygenase-like lactoylglutathione lyase family enzyme
VIVMPIVYVRDMDESVAFYEQLGFEVDIRSRSRSWTELRGRGRTLLALHSAEGEGAGRVELSMVAEEPLERLAKSARVARGIADEAFGRSIVLEDPSGLRIQVNRARSRAVRLTDRTVLDLQAPAAAAPDLRGRGPATAGSGRAAERAESTARAPARSAPARAERAKRKD